MLAAAVLAPGAAGPPIGAVATPASRVIVGYLASWKLAAAEGPVVDLSKGELTDIDYAFGSVSAAGLAAIADPCADAGICAAGPEAAGPGGHFAQLAALKRRDPSLRVLISLGGWNGSKYFSRAAATNESCEHFADSVINVFFKPFPSLFDGVDVDWEFPVAGGLPTNLHQLQDRENFTLLLTELRRKLAALSASNGRRYELTIAASADPSLMRNIDWPRVARIVDRIGVMTYDYDEGSKITRFNAPLFAAHGDPSPQHTIDATIRSFLKAGVPARQLVLGLPFYGRAYGLVRDVNNGLFQPANPTAAGDWGGEEGIDYRDLAARKPDQHGFHRHWSTGAQVPWLYNPQQQIWITYDDPESIALKAAYARSHSLAGVMIWQLSGDDGTLLPAIRRGLDRDR